MQALILAAGKSTRAYPLTLTKPKPLLKVSNKTLLEHNLENLNNIVSDVIVVVGYKKDLIKKYGNRYKNLKIRYVEQKRQLGTANAVLVAKNCIKDKFVLIMGDDLYFKEDIVNCSRDKYSMLTARVKNPQNFGVVKVMNNILIDFVEKPKRFVSNLISIGCYSLDKKIFECIEKIKKSERNEFELPDAVKLLSKEEKIYCIKSRKWLPVVYAWDLLTADKKLRKNKNVIGNSEINGVVKNSSIGDGCVINGHVYDSIIMDNTIIDKGSVVRDSVIGENVYFKGRVISKDNIHTTLNGNKFLVDRLGTIISDNVKAENVVIKPGCKIWPNESVINKVVAEDIKSGNI